MKILADEGVPLPLVKQFPKGWSIGTVKDLGWGGKSDSDVLKLAEANGYEVFVTTDKNIVHQQNMTKLKIKIYPLSTTSWPKLKLKVAEVIREIQELHPDRANIHKLDIDE